MENMKSRVLIIFMSIIIFSLQIIAAEENEYGIVEAWFNDKNATVETVGGVKLKIGEPADIKITIKSKINGHVFIKLSEPGITKAYDVLSGPSKQDERIDNLNIISGWSNTYAWRIVPNGAWKNGNAPINVLVQFYNSQTKESKILQFTIANPHILDEQYPGSGSTPVQTSGITPGATAPKEAPFVPLIAVLAVMIMIYLGKRR
ncbi:MAG TPA: sarcinarray family MAST domain-containing protein [Candidatus Methanoperedens sp.]|nr:sarcinarray family MAST domain-containing protein [Candidatus Methanoperedens sp.]HLB72022.1 sarcinarray family MAST domain-containing protein [Candidatus Methanoperedens sp.]